MISLADLRAVRLPKPDWKSTGGDSNYWSRPGLCEDEEQSGFQQLRQCHLERDIRLQSWFESIATLIPLNGVRTFKLNILKQRVLKRIF